MLRRFTRRWPFRDGLIRQSTALALLVVLLVTAAGVPIPVPRPSNAATSERFPCESCLCGCATADFCWRTCCCHTLAERLAWAEREGVRPPDFALADAARQGLDTTAWNGSAPSKRITLAVNKSSCCRRTSTTKSCCSTAPTNHSCATGSANGITASSTALAKPVAPQANPGVVMMRALACNGLGAGWLAVPPAMPPVAPIHSPGFDFTPAGQVAISLATFDFSILPPPVPPPESPSDVSKAQYLRA